MSSALIVDVDNIYKQVSNWKPGYVVKYFDLINDLERNHDVRFSSKDFYLKFMNENTSSFINLIRHNNATAHFGNELDVRIALAVAEAMAPQLQSVFYLGNCKSFVPVARYIHMMGRNLFVMSHKFLSDFEGLAEHIPLSSDFIMPRGSVPKVIPSEELNAPAPPANPDNVPANVNSNGNIPF